MGTLDKLNAVLQTLQQHGIVIGTTIGGLFFIINVIRVMMDTDQSPAARSERWSKVGRAFLCSVLIAAFPAAMQLAQGLGVLL